MRTYWPILSLPLLLIAGCDRKPEKSTDQPGVVTNILDQSPPEAGDVAAPSNAIAPVDTHGSVDAPSPAAAADGLVPAAMQGRWVGEAERCGDRSAALELTVAPDQLLFHESVGDVKRVTIDRDGRASVQAEFTGEGESWTRTLALRLMPDGRSLTITNDGTAVTRKRC